ncbi:MAG: caspase family protein [Lentisphaeria bacterium]|jgi:hypothetical protein|nr:caspase family protein [Lentisphaeria bacterium]MDP7740259.1 caspase family protein [Lentisphaeria bacterium]
MSVVRPANRAFLVLLLLSLGSGCITPTGSRGGSALPPSLPPGPVCYAVIFTSSDWRTGGNDELDPIDRNAGWIQTVRIYRHLLRLGYDARNISVFYLDAQPDYGDAGAGDIPESLRRMLDRRRAATSTKANLHAALRQLASRMRPQDHLVVHLSMHGRKGAWLESDTGETIRPRELRRMLKPLAPTQRLLIVDACHSEEIIERLDLPGTSIATARADELGWLERNFSFGEFFFAEFADCLGPGRPDRVEAAWSAAAARYRHAADWDYLKTRYGGAGLPQTTIELLTFEPVLRQESLPAF